MTGPTTSVTGPAPRRTTSSEGRGHQAGALPIQEGLTVQPLSARAERTA